jgi:hypothetical protein
MKPIKAIADQTEKNFKASMSVKFDIEQHVAEEDSELVVDVPEKTIIAIKSKVEYLVDKKEEGKAELKTLVNQAYDKQARLGIKQKKEPENKKLAEEYALARETYEA